MNLTEIIANLLAQAKERESMIGRGVGPECILIHDADALREAAKILQEQDIPNKPLTRDELRETDEPVWCRVDNAPSIPRGGYWCLCKGGKLITPALNRLDIDELNLKNWRLYRRKPKGAQS